MSVIVENTYCQMAKLYAVEDWKIGEIDSNI